MYNSKPWIGSTQAVTEALISIKADADALGHFTLHVPLGSVEFMRSDQQVIVDSDVFYELRGIKHSLLDLMAPIRFDPAVQLFGEDR